MLSYIWCYWFNVWFR